MVKWVAHPSNPNAPDLPAYFSADLNRVSLAVTAMPSNAALESEAKDELLKRLKIMQSGSRAQFEAAGIPINTVGDWIIAPSEPNSGNIPENALFNTMLAYKGQSFVIPSPRPGTTDAPVALTILASLNVYHLNEIHVTVNKPEQGESTQPHTFKLSQVSKILSKNVPDGNIGIDLYAPSEPTCKQVSESAQRAATVVVRLYERLYALGLSLNSYSPQRPTKYNTELGAWSSSFAVSPPNPQANARWTPETGELRIEYLPIVEDIALSMVSGDAGDFSSLQDRLHSRACDKLVGLPLTPRGVETYRYLAKQDPAVQDAVPSYTNGTLQLAITPQPTFGKLLASGKGGYDNATGWTGNLTGTIQDAIRSKKLYDRSSTLQLSYQGGSSYKNGSAAFAVTKPSRDPFPRLEFYSLSAGGDFQQNQNDRFGSQLPKQTLTVSETQATAGFKLSYDSFSIFDEADGMNVAPPTRKRNRHQIIFPTNFMFDRFSASTHQSGFHSNGDILQFSVSPEYEYNHDFEAKDKTKGLSELDIDTSSEYIKGIGAGGSIPFDRYQANTTISTFLGLRRARQFLARGQYGVGSLSAGGPIVRLFQLGGSTQLVPGLQFGEISPRTLAFAQGQFGIDLPSIMSLFGKEAPADFKLFDIRSSYLKMEYSRAAVSQAESVAPVAGLNPGVESFGPALEIGRLKNTFDLTAGYMYSPQSTLHPHGTFLLTVHIDDIKRR